MLDKNNYRELKKSVLIQESYEEMVALDETFLYFLPHPYQSKGAPYKDKSPFFVRKTVLEKLKLTAKRLDGIHPGYKLKVFDAYRPTDVQKFMIEFEKEKITLIKYQCSFRELDDDKQAEISELVMRFWSPIPEGIELNPPPHSTGGAIDLTIVDENGVELDMGTKIDELSEKSYSDYYKNSLTLYEKNRDLLYNVMSKAGFVQLPTEWWHFSYGDQIWALAKSDENEKIDALYGAI